MPSAQDTELATIFREMRRAMGVSRERIAGRLATSVETIDVLESGDLLALPEWSEVSRVVTAYAAQLGLDSRPILRRMKGQFDALKAGEANKACPRDDAGATPDSPLPSLSAKQPDAVPDPGLADAEPQAQTQTPAQAQTQAPNGAAVDAEFTPGSTPASPVTTDTENAERAVSRKSRIPGLARAALNWLLLFGLVGALGFGLWFASQNPQAVWRAVDSLPEPLPRAMRGAWELVRPLDERKTQPQVFDPDNRKSDKLR
ncbi:MAG: helix-turn-helix domain-containing protein [Hyphomicrobiaceae bacterium]|nr:helix-turn-helix domain-containing protein [Hyphomicrobiaceae bacterium]